MAIVKVSHSGNSVVFVDSTGAVFSAPRKALSAYLSRGTQNSIPFFTLTRLADTDGLYEDTKFGQSDVYVIGTKEKLSLEEYAEKYGDGSINRAMTSRRKKEGQKKQKYTEDINEW